MIISFNLEISKYQINQPIKKKLFPYNFILIGKKLYINKLYLQ